MQERYWLFRRDNGVYYLEDRTNRRQESLKTKDKAEAHQLLAARNQAAEQPMLNVAMAQAYLSVKSPKMLSRTWLEAMQELEASYKDSTLARWQKVMRSAPFRLLHRLPLAHTEACHFLEVMRHVQAGTSTNKSLRILHNRVLDLGWILTPVLSRKAWPKFESKKGKAIVQEEHQKLVESEWDAEWKLYYQMLWETGGSQTDIANLTCDNVDRFQRRIIYNRQKLRGRGADSAALVIGARLEKLLDQLPPHGALFPHIRLKNETDRSCRFRKRCLSLGIRGVTLHSYRYSWAERAQIAGMPMREAMAHLGHKSRTVHQAYAEKAEIITLPLEYYENERQGKILQFSNLSGQPLMAKTA